MTTRAEQVAKEIKREMMMLEVLESEMDETHPFYVRGAVEVGAQAAYKRGLTDAANALREWGAGVAYRRGLADAASRIDRRASTEDNGVMHNALRALEREIRALADEEVES